jgi:hypothetical protein
MKLITKFELQRKTDKELHSLKTQAFNAITSGVIASIFILSKR